MSDCQKGGGGNHVGQARTGRQISMGFWVTRSVSPPFLGRAFDFGGFPGGAFQASIFKFSAEILIPSVGCTGYAGKGGG